MRKSYLILATLAIAPPALARTIVRPMPFSEIVNSAEQIFVGTVERQYCRMENSGQTIRTYVVFKSLEVRKGKVGNELVLRLEGGTVGEDTLRIPSMPVFRTGHRYLCYVAGNGKNFSPIVGFFQGAFEVAKRNGKQVLVTQTGHELIGVEKDRFVFAPLTRKDTKRQAAPKIVVIKNSSRAGHPNASAIERRLGLGRKATRQVTRTKNSPVPQAKNVQGTGRNAGKTRSGEAPARMPATPPSTKAPVFALPKVLSRKADKGVRMGLREILSRNTQIERRKVR